MNSIDGLDVYECDIEIWKVDLPPLTRGLVRIMVDLCVYILIVHYAGMTVFLYTITNICLMKKNKEHIIHLLSLFISNVN